MSAYKVNMDPRFSMQVHLHYNVLTKNRKTDTIQTIYRAF